MYRHTIRRGMGHTANLSLYRKHPVRRPVLRRRGIGRVNMKILVACEESQTVTIELRKLGHEAYSCDIIDCSGGHPEWHIQQNVIPLLNGDCSFSTVDGTEHRIGGRWDMIIAFPPCTYLTVTGNRWFNVDRYGEKALKRFAEREDAANFFMKIANADCKKIAIENPVGFMNTYYRKPAKLYSRICLEMLLKKRLVYG